MFMALAENFVFKQVFSVCVFYSMDIFRLDCF